jgi:hypothetical protein
VCYYEYAIKVRRRIVRALDEHVAVEERALEQWFLVPIGDDEKAKNAVSNTTKVTDDVVEVIDRITASDLACWGLTEGEVRLVLPGEPVGG